MRLHRRHLGLSGSAYDFVARSRREGVLQLGSSVIALIDGALLRSKHCHVELLQGFSSVIVDNITCPKLIIELARRYSVNGNKKPHRNDEVFDLLSNLSLLNGSNVVDDCVDRVIAQRGVAPLRRHVDARSIHGVST